MRPVAVYSALRLGLFLAALLILRVLGVSGILSLVIALVLAMLLSFIVLRRQRDAVTRALMERKAAAGRPSAEAPPRARSRWSFGGRLAEDAAVEDAAVQDAARDRRTTRPTDGPAGDPR
ncbi:DUF4229 domain-containing protein [Aquipuribacter sp. MA13-6]|uniref:DUF4229 domain-containing protein n=1 Tax=unclassified Aquipuribacter TaxID=2635084 RepID=UPI003EEFD533